MPSREHIAMAAILFVLFGTGCNETLPARDDLNGLVTTSLTMASHREASGQNYLRFFLTVKNNTDETIEEKVISRGTIQIQWIPPVDGDSPGVDPKRTIIISSQNIFRAPSGYDAGTGILKLPSRDSIVYYVSWNMRSNDSTYLPNYWSVIQDNQCLVLYSNGFISPRRVSARQRFIVSASVKLFDRLAILYASPVTLSACFLAPYVREANPATQPCTNVNVVDPCVIIGE